MSLGLEAVSDMMLIDTDDLPASPRKRLRDDELVNQGQEEVLAPCKPWLTPCVTRFEFALASD